MAGAIVQSREASTGAVGSTTIALAFSSANTSGNNIWVVGHVGNPALTMTYSDSAGNTYSSNLSYATDGANNNRIGHAQCQNCAAATPTVTVTFSASEAYRAIFICEISGVQNAAQDGNSANNQFNVGTGTDAIVSGNATNTATATMLSLTCDDSAQFTPVTGTGFTSISTFWNFGLGGIYARAEYKTGVAVATQGSTFTAGGSLTDANTVMVMLKESGAAAAPLTIDIIRSFAVRRSASY